MDTSYRLNFLKAVPSYVRTQGLRQRVAMQSHVPTTTTSAFTCVGNFQKRKLIKCRNFVFLSAIIVKYEPKYCACDLIAVL